MRAWNLAEVEEIVESMRGGATVMSGGSRAHTTYGFRSDAWVSESFDEGYTAESSTSEAAIRSMIVSDPELFRDVLVNPRWRRFGDAFMRFLAGDGDPASARALLDDAMVYGDRLDQGRVYAAMLAWPDEPPSSEAVAVITQKLGDFTAYHAFMTPAQWDRSEATARIGVVYIDRLRAIVGDVVGAFALRATFHEHAGDREAAARDLTREIERSSADDWRYAGWQQSLARLL